jgi:hypothetical protein
MMMLVLLVLLVPPASAAAAAAGYTAVIQISDFSSRGLHPEVVHQWVLGWQFAAGRCD